MLLSVEDVSYTYPESIKPALSSVSFSLEQGEYVAILGANGSGKSTLARCIAGLLSPDSGSIQIQSKYADTANKTEQGSVPVALVFQSPGDQIVAETVELDIAFGPENLGLPQDEMTKRVSAALDIFSLRSLAAASTQKLTSGQKQHLALAGMQVLAPQVLLLDEPTSMLSPLARESLLAYLDRFHTEGGTVLHITHDMTEAARAERIFVLHEGQPALMCKSTDFAHQPIDDLETWGLYDRNIHLHQSEPGTYTFDKEEKNAIECRQVCFGPLKDFSLTVNTGTITTITGESGCGKSVLLELCAGLRIPDSGTIMMGKGETISLAVQESEASLFSEFVADDVAFGPRNSGLAGKALVSRVSNAMNLVGLPFDIFADRRTFSLSGGERRKAALAGIIAMDSSIILLDEPSSGLDVTSRGQLLQLIIELKKQGKTVIFTTNRIEEAAIADQVVELPAPQYELRSGFHPSVSDMVNPQEDSRTRVERKAMSSDQRSLERLRKGSSGSYRKLDTGLHRLDPLSKYILIICCLTASLVLSDWRFLVFLCLIECIPIGIARYPLKKLVIGILKILPWLVLIGVIQYLLVPGNLQSVVFALRFIALYIPLVLFIFITSHTEIMYGMEDLLTPLRFLRIPVRDVSLVTGIVFRFINLLYDEAARITTARIIRGAGIGKKKGLMVKISSMASLFVPLMIRTLTRAERLAQAITARYYGATKNSRYLHWNTGKKRILVIATMILTTGLLIYVSAKFT